MFELWEENSRGQCWRVGVRESLTEGTVSRDLREVGMQIMELSQGRASGQEEAGPKAPWQEMMK